MSHADILTPSVVSLFDSLVSIGGFIKIYFSYIAKYIKSQKPDHHEKLRSQFGWIVDFVLRWNAVDRKKLYDLQRVISASPVSQSSREPLENVANLRPDGTMDAEVAGDLLKWVAVEPSATEVRKYPVRSADNPAAYLALCGELYDDWQKCEEVMQSLAESILFSREYNFVLRNESLAETEKSFMEKITRARSQYLDFCGLIAEDRCEELITRAKVDVNPTAAMTFLRGVHACNRFVVCVIARLLAGSSSARARELTMIAERLKDTTLGAGHVDIGAAPIISFGGLRPVTLWMAVDALFGMIGWKEGDFDTVRGASGVILVHRGWGREDVVFDWTGVMDIDDTSGGMTNKFLNRMQTVTTRDPAANIVKSSHIDTIKKEGAASLKEIPKIEIFGDDTCEEWYVIERMYAQTSQSDQTLVYRGWAENKFTSLPRARVAFAWGMTTRPRVYAEMVGKLPRMRDWEFYVSRFLAEKPVVASSDKIRESVSGALVKYLSAQSRWKDVITEIYTDEFRAVCTRAIESVIPRGNNKSAEYTPTRMALVFRCADALVKAVWQSAAMEVMPDSVYETSDGATIHATTVLNMINRAVLRVDEAKLWTGREITFKEFIMTVIGKL